MVNSVKRKVLHHLVDLKPRSRKVALDRFKDIQSVSRKCSMYMEGFVHGRFHIFVKHSETDF